MKLRKLRIRMRCVSWGSKHLQKFRVKRTNCYFTGEIIRVDDFITIAGVFKAKKPKGK